MAGLMIEDLDPEALKRKVLLSQMAPDGSPPGALPLPAPPGGPLGASRPGPMGGFGVPPPIDLPGGGMPASPGTPPPPSPNPMGSFRNQLEGFDYGKMDSGHISPKYVFAKYAQNYNVTDPAQRAKLLADLQNDPSGYFKQASFGGSKGDKLMVGGALDPKFEGINTFDVIRAAGEGGKGWQWGAEPAGGGRGAVPMPATSPFSPFPGNSLVPDATTDGASGLIRQLLMHAMKGR